LYVNNVRGQAANFTLAVDAFQGQERDISATSARHQRGISAITLTRSKPKARSPFFCLTSAA
jgi:hypothetical protein